MVKKIYLFLCITFSFLGGFGQTNCDLSETALYDTTIPCSQNCTSIQVRLPDIKTTTTYKVIQDQYQPYPYQCPSDVELHSLYIDDKYSDIIDMPFSFCFYGSTYKRIVIGSNGIVTFDLTNANCQNSYVINSGETLPGTGSNVQCSAFNSYYPRACIMGAYYDIDPDTVILGSNQRNFRISYYFTGIAPYRKMVIVYDHIPLYSCTNLIASEEIVLYESTGIIDVHIGNKASCSNWYGGLAILGIQNWDRNQAVTPPGRNNAVWTESNKTYRFIPSGTGPSLFRGVNLYQGNTLIGPGTVTSDTTTGQLTAIFSNSVCLSTDTAVFRAVAQYASCSNPLSQINYETKIVVRHNALLDVATTLTPATCASGGNSIVTVTAPVGSQYEYSIDNGLTYQSSPNFTLPGGVYAVYARNAQAGCLGATIVTVPTFQSIRYTTNITNVLCYGTATGKVIVSTQTGVAPFQYSGDSGITYQSSDTLLLPAGRHVIRVRDVNGCIKDTTVMLTQPNSISLSQQVVNAFCSGNADGKITVSAIGGTPGYQYALLNTTASYQADSVLNANVGTFTVYVKDVNNCLDSSTNIRVLLNDTMRLAPLPDTAVCVGSSIVLGANTNATRFAWAPNVFVNDTTLARPAFSPQDTSTYYLIAKLGTLCTRTDTFNINVLKRPIPNAGNDTIICFGTYAYFNATAIRGNTFRWRPAAFLNNANIPNARATGYTPIRYTVEVTDPYGCGFKEYDTLTLTVRPKVEARAGQDTTATLGLPVQLFGCCMDIYRWEPSGIFENDTARNPIGHFPPGNTQVVMTTTTPEGCEGRDTVLVKGYVGPTYYVPSGFTPNGDGRNDILRPIPVGIVETYYFNVYNRYGQMLYTTKTFMEGWDGRWKGELQPQAAYVWMVKGKGIDGKIVEQKGTVVLMR